MGGGVLICLLFALALAVSVVGWWSIGSPETLRAILSRKPVVHIPKAKLIYAPLFRKIKVAKIPINVQYCYPLQHFSYVRDLVNVHAHTIERFVWNHHSPMDEFDVLAIEWDIIRRRGAEWLSPMTNDSVVAIDFEQFGRRLSFVDDVKHKSVVRHDGSWYDRMQSIMMGTNNYPRTLAIDHVVRLGLNGLKRANSSAYTTPADVNQQSGEDRDGHCRTERPSINKRFTMIFCLCFGGFILALWVTEHVNENRRVLRSSLIVFGLGCSEAGLLFLVATMLHPYTLGLPPQWLPAKWNPCPDGYRDYFPHGESVTRKLLTVVPLLYYSKGMANILAPEKQVAIIGSLCEGSSIRSIERLTGVHRDTVMRLGVRVGQACTAMMSETLRGLNCTCLEMDEIWGFIGKKEKHVRPTDDATTGDVWTFGAIDADTKPVPSFKVSKRTNATAEAFVQDVASRMRNRVQISTDGLRAYVDAIEHSFGGDVDYAQIKTYGHEEVSNNRRYSAPEFVSSEKRPIFGNPNVDLISTSYIERLNATTRLHMRRLTRLTLAFSKKFENSEAAVGLHFAYYNFVKRHNTLRMTPAMAVGVSGTQWTVGELLKAAA